MITLKSLFSSLRSAIFGTVPSVEPKVEPPPAAPTPPSCLVLGIIESLKKEPEAWGDQQYDSIYHSSFVHQKGAKIRYNEQYIQYDRVMEYVQLVLSDITSPVLSVSEQQLIYDAVQTYLVRPERDRVNQAFKELGEAARAKAKATQSHFESLGCPTPPSS